LNIQVNGQGCIAIRSTGNSCTVAKAGESGGWIFNLNNRYFKSYKHFRGTHEEKNRVEDGTEVINHSFSWDLTLTRILNRYWSVYIDIPVLSNTRSSMYEHYGNGSSSPNARHKTKSFGIGDTRLSVNRWIFDPATSHRGNLQAGLGLKLPTGDYETQDFFHKEASDGSDSAILGPVDQSIQLGDGGTGITFELNGYYNITPRTGFYGNLYYMINPREQNGVSTARGGNASSNAIKYFSSTMSVPDQYLVRFGAAYLLSNQMNISGGIRIEGIPSSDLVGGDKGFRRPGYVISAEPTITYMTKGAGFYLSVPVAFERNRTQNYSDKLRSAATGTHVQGDAAFADYLVNVGVTLHL